MSRMQREKGAQAERAAAILFRTVCPDASRRVSGEEGQGEALGRDLKGTPGLCVQVKEMAAPRPLAALDEAITAAQPGEIPLALVRQSRRGSSTPFRVVLTLRDALLLLDLRQRFDTALPSRLVELGDELDTKLEALGSDPSMKARIG